MARLVFTSTLPVLGTWVGTVLAFYFARDNLIAASQAQQTATDTTMQLNRQIIGLETPVREVMIKRAAMKGKTLDQLTQTPSDLLAIDEFKTLIKAIGFVWLTNTDLAKIK